jgi:hypothetical protein
MLAQAALEHPASGRRHPAFKEHQSSHSSPQPTANMDNGWPFRKIKHDCEIGSSGADNEKTVRNRWYVPVEFAHRLLEENWPVPWLVAGLPRGCCYLNHHRVRVPLVPHEGRQRRYEICRC